MGGCIVFLILPYGNCLAGTAGLGSARRHYGGWRCVRNRSGSKHPGGGQQVLLGQLGEPPGGRNTSGTRIRTAGCQLSHRGRGLNFVYGNINSDECKLRSIAAISWAPRRWRPPPLHETPPPPSPRAGSIAPCAGPDPKSTRLNS